MIDFVQNIPSKYTFFSGAKLGNLASQEASKSTLGSFSRVDHMLENSTNLNTFSKLKLYQAFSDHDGVRLQINYKEKLEIYMHMKQRAT